MLKCNETAQHMLVSYLAQSTNLIIPIQLYINLLPYQHACSLQQASISSLRKQTDVDIAFKSEGKIRMANVGIVLLGIIAFLGLVEAQLKLGYYDERCPRAEQIVQDFVHRHISNAPVLAAPLLRMQFHDCFVRVSHSFLFRL